MAHLPAHPSRAACHNRNDHARFAFSLEWILKRISPALGISLGFVLVGLPFLGLPGLHVDASSELACFYPCSHPAFRPSVLGFEVPLMVLSYLGAFKAWLYQPLLLSLQVTPFVLRLPLLLIGAATVWMFFALLHRTVGRHAAIAGTLLLATDSSFVVSTAIDFGPIVFLHFFLLAGVLLLLRFERTQSPKLLALAFLLFGLALWHKVLFIWMLVALSAATLAVFPHRVRMQFSLRRLGLAVLFLCLGASPLLFYNVVTGGHTLHTGDVMSAKVPVSEKLLQLKKTLDGSALLGFVTDETWKPEYTRQPSGLLATVSVRLNYAVGGLLRDWMLYAFLASCCLLPWLWFTLARKASIFALVYLAVTWIQMAAIPNTGGTIHHAILLWPFPHFLMAVAGVQLGRRFARFGMRAMTAVLVLLAGCNGLLLNQYMAHLATGGTTATFTDAVYPLFDYMSSLGPRNFAAVDWGYADTLCLLSDGEMNVEDLSFVLQSPTVPQGVRSLIAGRQALFIGHPQADEKFPGVHARLTRTAEEMGYTRQVLETIYDRNRRPRFEVIRYVASE